MWWQTSKIVKVCFVLFNSRNFQDEARSKYWYIEYLGFFLPEVASSDAKQTDCGFVPFLERH